MRIVAFIIGFLLLILTVFVVAVSFYGRFIIDPGFELLNDVGVFIAAPIGAVALFLFKFAFNRKPIEPTIHIPKNTPPNLRRLAEELDSPSEKKRQRGLVSLGKFQHPLVRDILADATKNGYDDVRIGAAFRLAKISTFEDNRALSGLVEGLRHSTREVRLESIDLLSKMKDVTRRTEILKLIFDDNPEVRNAIAGLLAEQPSLESMSYLLQAMDDPDIDVASNSIIAVGRLCGKLQDNRATSKLLSILQNRHDSLVKVFAVEALGEIGDPAAVPILITLLRKPYRVPVVAPGTEETWRGFDLSVREAIAKSLEKIGTPQALTAVEVWRKEQESTT